MISNICNALSSSKDPINIESALISLNRIVSNHILLTDSIIDSFIVSTDILISLSKIVKQASLMVNWNNFREF